MKVNALRGADLAYWYGKACGKRVFMTTCNNRDVCMIDLINCDDNQFLEVYRPEDDPVSILAAITNYSLEIKHEDDTSLVVVIYHEYDYEGFLTRRFYTSSICIEEAVMKTVVKIKYGLELPDQQREATS